MARLRRYLPLAALLALGIGWFLSQSLPLSSLRGKPAPDFRLPSLHGATVSLADLRGRVVALSFWATWCEACRTELPALSRAAARLGPRGLAAYAVNVGEPPETVAPFAARVAAGLPVLLDRAGATGERYGVRLLPSLVLVDRSGTVAAVATGALRERALREMIEPLLED